MTETINSANAAGSTLFLGHNGEWWDFWLIVSGIFAALAATAIGVTTAGSIISHKREASTAQNALDRFKLQTEEKISDANARALEAQRDLARYKAPRNLTAEQSAKLIDDLRPFGPATYDIAYPKQMEPGSFLVPQLIEVFTKLNWRFISYEGPLPKQELSLIETKRLPPDMYAERPFKNFFAGETSQLIGIKISREYRSKTTLDAANTLNRAFIEFGQYAQVEWTEHRYDAEGRQLPVSEVIHILVGSK